MTRSTAIASILLVTLLLLTSGCNQKVSITIGVTSTLEDSGLLAELITQFEQQHPMSIKPVVASSGQIHTLLTRGDIDSAITHYPDGEQALFTTGVISHPQPLMHNDFVLVGPVADTPHVKHSLTLDEAFLKIINTGEILVSRNDNSGTYQTEQHWWQQTSLPNNSDQLIRTGTGMGASLTIAAERNAYILVDRATWINFGNKQSLALLFEDPDNLPNTYSLLSATSPQKDQAVTVWEQWLITEGKIIIKNYRINNQPVFFID